MENKYKGKPIFVNSDDDFLTRGGEQAKKLWIDAAPKEVKALPKGHWWNQNQMEQMGWLKTKD